LANFASNKFAGIQNSVGIERLLEPTMKVTRHLARRFRPPAFLCQADSVFACNHTAPSEDLRKKIVERALNLFADGMVAIVSVRHDVDVNIAIAGVAEAGNRESMLCLQLLGELHQIDQMTSRHNDVLV